MPNKPIYYPFEQAITDAIINCYHNLDKEEDFPIIAAEIHSTIYPFVESGLLTEVKSILIDRTEKTIKLTFGTNKNFNDGPYEVPTDTIVLEICWKNITPKMVEIYKKKKEESIKNGIAGSNCKVIGKHDY